MKLIPAEVAKLEVGGRLHIVWTRFEEDEQELWGKLIEKSPEGIRIQQDDGEVFFWPSIWYTDAVEFEVIGK